MKMTWYPSVVYYMGLLDAGLIMAGGITVAIFFIFKMDIADLWDRVAPALGTLIGTNIAAAIILGATRWLIS